MKILFISTDVKLFDSRSSVHERFVGFSQLADEVHVVVARASKHTGVYQLAPNVFVYPTVRTSNLCAMFRSFFTTLRILRKQKDSSWVISVQDPFEQGWIGLIVSRIFKIPLHVQVHTDIVNPLFASHSFLDRIRVFCAGPVVRGARRIRVDATRVKESLVSRYNLSEESIDVLHIYIDVHGMLSQHIERKIDGRYILYVGRFEPEKNVESIIRGFAELTKKFLDVKLVLVGSGHLEEAYKTLARSLHVADKLIIVPWTNSVSSYMRFAEVCVLASRFEGFALVLMESLLNGCPVVTTDVGAIGGLIPHEAVHIFPYNDHHALAQALTHVFSFSEKERHKVEEFRPLLLSRIPQTLPEYTKLFRASLEHTIKKNI